MVTLEDPGEVRRRLEYDRIWSAFSIADLDPPYAAFATWFGSPGGSDVVLLYRAYDPPLVVCHGAASVAAREGLAAACAACDPRGGAYVSALPGWRPLLDRQFGTFTPRPMVRMHLDLGRFQPTTTSGLRRLDASDLSAVRLLYRDEPPAFFLPAQLHEGVYFGVYDAAGLAAVAGTHVLSTRGRVGAIGNVHTRPDRRRQGLAAAVTSAVASGLLAMGIDTIVLNITAANAGAARVYGRLGFTEYAAYDEGMATLRTAPRDDGGAE